MSRSLINRVKVASLEKGIYDNCYITSLNVDEKKGKSGIINKMVYLKFAQLVDGKRVAETAMDLGWWKPDPTSDYFFTNLQEMCVQLHGLLTCFIDEEKAFDAFDNVFEAHGIKDHKELETSTLKKTEVAALLNSIKDAFYAAASPYIKDTEKLFRLKLTTNHKGEDVDIPKYGLFTEPMTNESTLKFTDNEIKTHSKAGNVEKKDSKVSNVDI